MFSRKTAYGYCPKCERICYATKHRLKQKNNPSGITPLQCTAKCRKKNPSPIEPFIILEQKKWLFFGDLIPSAHCPKCKQARLEFIFAGTWD
jgi:hypothetical protein